MRFYVHLESTAGLLYFLDFELTKQRADLRTDERTDVGKLAILENKKIVLLTQSLKLDNEIMVKVLHNVNMCLIRASQYRVLK